MGKRKIYQKSNIASPKDKNSLDQKIHTLTIEQDIPPSNKRVTFEANATTRRSFDFSPWYNVNIDSITSACQRQIERFLNGQDAEIEVTTVTGYCRSGVRFFLDYLLLYATVHAREITLADINRELIDGYIGHLTGQGIRADNRYVRYMSIKSVLLPLGRRGLITLIDSGDAATFPRNPFPNSHQKNSGESTPLPKAQRQAFVAAVKQAVMPIWCNDVPLTSYLLVCALLIVALHTGRNTTPLLEMSRDCLHAHPKDNSCFLVLKKRRGHNSSKTILRAESTHERLLESTPTIKSSVERLIRHIIARTEPLLAEAPPNLQSRIWLYRAPPGSGTGKILALTENQLRRNIKKIIDQHNIKDTDGKSLRVNISRIRKTFANRIFELLEGDLATTALTLGSTQKVTEQNYLAPNEDSKRNWRFMGEILVEELMSHTIGATYHTPTGRCSDPINGQYAPKSEGATCINFLNCLRCRHYVVTGEDLYKLYSFYFRVFAERKHMDKRRWSRDYAHIPRLIDEYIVAEGLRRGCFKLSTVEAAREHARTKPHPFWSYEVSSNLEYFA